MRSVKLTTLAGIIVLLVPLMLSAQDSTQANTSQSTNSPMSGLTKAVITGSAFADFRVDRKNDIRTNFYQVGFSPILLWKLSDKLFFESEIEMIMENGEVGIDLEYAKFSYFLNKYMTIGVGRMLTPFGAYVKRLEPDFVDRFPNPPLLMHHVDGMSAVGPNGAEMGADIHGGLQLGLTKLNYDVYVSNGPMLNSGSEDRKMGGALEYENFTDNNSNKAVGGRIGFLPLSNSSLEIGISGNTGLAGDAKDEQYKNVRATAYAADLSYFKVLQSISSLINIKGQVNMVQVTQAYYPSPTDTSAPYTFDNKSQVYFIQLGIRPALLKGDFLKNIELLGRYNSLTYPKEATWGGGTTTRIDVGLTYWLSWRSGLRLAYEMTKNPNGTNTDAFLIRFASGF